jgi:sterol desaturase/sphingolipid hydroxylase (fatty acid hydroxylase superfamily)
MDKQLLLKWLPFVLVIVFEHLILTRWYHKQSSVQRLLAAGTTARADMLVWFMFYVAWPLVQTIATVITIPGIVYLAVTRLSVHGGWTGIFGGYMPENQVLVIVIWMLALDFSLYVSHVLMHRVPWLWHFHKLHHAATEFNIITGIRFSLAERLFNDLTIFFFLTMVLGLPSPDVAFTVMFLYRVIDLLQHSDLPWDYGIFGYAIASPRYHRMHHSNCTDDSNANYGNIFSFWDYLFGTLASRYRQSSQVADSCSLGLQDSEEGARINNSWYLAPFQATGIDYVWTWYRNRKSAEVFTAAAIAKRHRNG